MAARGAYVGDFYTVNHRHFAMTISGDRHVLI